MTAARITNKSEAPLQVGGVSIPPGRSVKIENWHQHAQGDNVAAWTVAGAIDVEEDKPAVPAKADPPAKKSENKDGVQSADRR